MAEADRFGVPPPVCFANSRVALVIRAAVPFGELTFPRKPLYGKHPKTPLGG
jgi:hypothetical protein